MNQGKQINLAFVRAYLKARDEAAKTGKPVPIKGFGGYKVSAPKDINKDLET